MYAPVNKLEEENRKSVSNSVTQKKSDGKKAFELVDNRPEAKGQNIPVTQLQLATGRYRLKNRFFNTNLRNDDQEKTVSAKLRPGTEVNVIPKGMRVSNFRAGLIRNEHSWVQTQNNGQGWIEDSMLVKEIFDQAPDQGSFIDNLVNRPNYLQELENHINIGSNFDATTNTLNVSNARIQEAATHLKLGQQAQTEHIRSAFLANPNPDIYDARIANHAAKNALWNQLHPNVDAGVNTQGAPMDNNVKLKAKAALGQIISTPAGFDLMNQVNQLSANLGIPIHYLDFRKPTTLPTLS